MRNAMFSLVGLLAVIGAASPQEPALQYQIELVIHQGPKQADGGSIVSRPTMHLLQEQNGQVAVGQRVRLGDKEHDLGLAADAKVRPSKQGLVLSLKITHSELVEDATGEARIRSQQTDFDKPIKLNTTFVMKPGKIGEKTLWAEVRVKPYLP